MVATDHLLQELASLERPAGSAGEARAAGLIAAALDARGDRTRIEEEVVHGTYWWPIGLACSLAAIAAAGGRVTGARGRVTGAALAAVACAAVVDDLEIGRRPLRQLLPQRVAHNVIGEFGPSDGATTLVIHAHHDAARTGLVFHPAGAKFLARIADGVMERVGGTPAPTWGAAAGPAVVAPGQLLGSKRARRVGGAISAGYAAAMANIWRSPVVPGPATTRADLPQRPPPPCS